MKENNTPSKAITLKYPFPASTGEALTALTMRRPQVIDMLASNESAADDGDRAINLLANLCMVPAETFNELDAADFVQVNEAFEELSDFSPIEDYQPGTAIAIDFPITIAGGTQVTALTLRRPKVLDIQSANRSGGSDAKKECVLFAALTGVSEAAIQSLDWADYRKLKQIYGDFLE